MSFKSYTKWWIKTKAETQKLWQLDQVAIQKAKATKKRNIAFNLVSGIYARYATLVQEIDACLDQMCQPQKRMTVRKIMDAATTRLHELKDELQMIELHEYHYIDGAMIELKLIPYEVEILYPAMFIHRPIEIQDMWEKILKGEKIYIPPPPPPPEVQPEENELTDAELLMKEALPVEKVDAKPEETLSIEESAKKKEKKKRRPKKFIPLEPTLSPEEIEAFEKKQIITNAVKLIQIHEKARQARMYFFQVNKLNRVKEQQQDESTSKLKKVEEPDLNLWNTVATRIVRNWKGYHTRKILQKKERERRLLIGMTEPSWKSKEVFEKFQHNLEQRRALRDERIREYIQANLDEKVRVLRVIAPGLMEDIGDEIRAWFRHWYDVARNFDKFPEEEKGGSILVVKYETITPEQWLLDAERKKREAKKKKADKAKLAAEKAKKKKEEAERKKKEKEKKKKEAAAAKKRRGKDFEYKLAASPALQQFEEGFKEHKKIWDERDDMLNPLETHYMDIITDEKCYEMQMEVRPKVDELMRLELEMLEDALEKDKMRMKGKKGKAKKKKKKKPKKKKKKGRKKRDPTGNRKIEDLFQELVDNGIIRTYPETHLHEYRGDFSYSNYEKRMLEFDPPATLGDVRHAVVMNCILPLGVTKMMKPKSVLIAGPRQSGKHLLANAIFTETKSVLFDLSPPIMAGKYPGKQGMKMLLHLINKMSRLLQPSIIFFDGAEAPFYKKVPKPEKALEPKRLGNKILKGIVKPLLPEDRVLVLGITGKPWTARAKPLQKAFQRIILIPRPDYGSTYLYWREMLMPYHSVDRNFECSTITTVSKYYPLPEIKKAVEKVMVPRRIIQLDFKPLTHAELYNAILTGAGPITEKEFSKFIKWFKKTPLAKEKGKILAIAEKLREAEAKRAEKEAQKKK